MPKNLERRVRGEDLSAPEKVMQKIGFREETVKRMGVKKMKESMARMEAKRVR